MKDWKERTLSQAGKEVLIKSIIQAIPTFSMNCFLLPITTCQEIERVTARFFWGSTLEDRKCHWTGWNILTSSKANGGIGFREIHFFNLAMLAKQIWILIQNPSSISYRILKAKYFPRTEILEAKLGHKPSYLWRSLLSSKEIIQEGMAWRVGNGRSIKIRTDRWIGVNNPVKPGPTTLEEEDEDCTVDTLIDDQGRKWHEGKLLEKFNQTDREAILKIPLSWSNREDCRVWRFNENGMFTVRSAYHMTVEKFSRIHDNTPSTSVPAKEWKKLWSLKVAPRVKLFIWRACRGAIPTRVNLCRRGYQVDPICALCGEAEESSDHLFIACTKIWPIWYSSVRRLNLQEEGVTTVKELIWKKIMTCPDQYLAILCYLIWEIWNCRNKLCFDNKSFSLQEVLAHSYAAWQDYNLAIGRTEAATPQNKHKETWERPKPGELKLNSDVAVLDETKIGMGFVVRDANGAVILAGKNEQDAAGSSVVLEGLALRNAMKLAAQFHLKVDTVESDSKQLVDTINGKCKPAVYCDVIAEDIRQLAMDIGCKKVSFIPRGGNQVAHQAARGQNFLSIRKSPHHLIRFLEGDLGD